jgi:integrase
LARRVHHIISNGGSDASYLYTYYLPSGVERYIDANEINTALKAAAGSFGLYDLGYGKGDVSSHSLRAGGAMAMHLNGCSDLKIRKQGRWRSDTFLMYIHQQISAFSTGVSLKMSKDIQFRAIAGPTVR